MVVDLQKTCEGVFYDSVVVGSSTHTFFSVLYPALSTPSTKSVL